MHWEKKITIRVTFRRIVGAIVAASTVANLVIVGAVVGADSPASKPIMTSTSITALWTATLFLPTAETAAVIPITPTLIVESTPIETFTPSETSTPTQTPTDPPPSIVCVKRFFWPGYRVRAGDTLFRIALSSGSTVNELMRANCRADDRLFIGELIYVPRLWNDPITITPTASATGTPTPTETLAGIPTDTPTATPTDTLSPTPTATLTLSPTPTITPTSTETNAPVGCDQARVIADVTVPPGTVMLPGTTFTKTWSVMNVGQCAWTTSYQIVFLQGEQMGAPASSSLPQNVAVGQSINISVRMTAPRSAGLYLSYWTLKNANGAQFDEPLSLEINVSDQGPTPTATQTPSPTPTDTPRIILTISPSAGSPVLTVP